MVSLHTPPSATAVAQAPPRKRTVSISVLLGAIFVVVFSCALGAFWGEFINVSSIENLAQNLLKSSVPEFIDSQKRLSNIEALRRLADLAYSGEDAAERRKARLNASALTADAVFQKNNHYSTLLNGISRDIGRIARSRDVLDTNREHFSELHAQHARAIDFFVITVGDSNIRRDLHTLYLPTSPFFENTKTLESAEENAQQNTPPTTRATLEKALDFLRKRQPALLPEAEQYFQQALSLHATIQSMTEQHIIQKAASNELHASTEKTLLELRDGVSTGVENLIVVSLTTIHTLTTSTKQTLVHLLFAALVFLMLCYCTAQVLITKPARWISRKLQALRQGDLSGDTPTIRTRELAEVAELLIAFSDHLADLYATTQTLTERAAEKRDLEEIMRSVFYLSLDGFLVWNQQGLERTSSGMLQLMGLKNEDHLRDTWSNHGFSQALLDRIYQETADNHVVREELELRTVNGEYLPCEITSIPITLRDKPNILTIVRDLRQQKINEEALRKAKDQAEDAYKSKSDFLSRMSHELRTPMNGVLGLTRIALQSDPPPTQRDLLAKIHSSGQLLLGIINDILDFSKIEQNMLQLEHAPFALHEVLDSLTDMLTPQAHDKHIALTIQYEPPAMSNTRLMGDSLRLAQVLLNLAGNAVKFTEQGFVRITISCIAETDSTRCVRFDVHDSGIGMTDEQLSTIFQPFMQGDVYTTRKYGGTGLGLMISKLLVEAMGSSISVASTLGQGSHFSFDITFSLAEALPAPVALAQHNAQLGIFAGKRILVAEDNAINQIIIEALLLKFGCDITLVANGKRALAALEMHPFDCVLMDIQMPEMDGLTCANHIRNHENPAVRSLPIIAMTSHAMPEDAEKILDNGMDDHLIKPLELDVLTVCLKKHLG